MKKIIKYFVCLTVTLFLTVDFFAQGISVSDFKLNPTDLTANLQGTTVFDQNGEKCALIKIQTTQTGFNFDVGTLGVMKVLYKTAEVWVYVPFGVKRIKINHPQLGSTTYDFTIPIERAKTYEMKLIVGEVKTIVTNAVTSQYILFEVTPSNATIELDGQTLEAVDGTATTRKPFGKYKYRVQAPRYAPKEGEVVVSDPKNKHVVSLQLSPQFDVFTITAPQNSDIYVNNTRKGSGSCHIEWAYGTYMIEARLANHRSSFKEYTLNANSPRSISLTAPTPIYGSLDLNSVPANAEIFIAGKKVGTTPMYIDNYLIGDYKVKFVKSGYADKEENIKITEGQITTINTKLEKNAGYATSSYGESIMTYTVNGVSFKMVKVDGGTFTMGGTSEQGKDSYADEKPTHSVTLSSYYIGQMEVTQALWRAVMGKNPSYNVGDNLPVTNVSWNDCQEFIKKLNSLTGAKFRLPTEAEWEYAARGGKKSKKYKYSGSNNIDDVAWYTYNSGGKTHAVGTKRPNELGIYDMSGNVYEWCSDWYDSYSSMSQTNPKGANSGSYRVMRGGCYSYDARYCRVSYRSLRNPTDSSLYSGLRLVCP